MKPKKLLIYGCLLIVFVIVFMLVMTGGAFAVTFLAINKPGGETSPTGSGESLLAGNGTEQIFVLTHYYPCTPDFRKTHDCDPSMQGDESMATGGIAVYDESSPMGFYAKYKDKRYDFSMAVVQPKNDPLIPITKPGKLPAKGVYFDNNTQIFVPLDHYASDVTASNSLDLMASDAGYERFIKRIKEAGLYVDSNGENGRSKGVTRAKGTLADIINAGTGAK